MKTNQMRTLRGSLFRACSSKGVSHHCSHFGRDTKAGRGAGKLDSGKKGAFLDEGCWPLEAGGGLTGSRAPCVIG